MNHTEAGADRPRVVALPPVIYLGYAFVGVALQKLSAWSLPGGELLEPLGWTLVAAGGFAVAVAVVQFIRAGTHLEPYKPALALVSTGIYRYSRNPIYVGFSFIFLGAALLLSNTWLLLLLLPTLLTLHFGVVLREEEYLLGKFGETYREYQSQVRRWL